MAYGYGKTYYNDIFKNSICKVCGLCRPRNVSFCMVAWGWDKNRFYKILEHVNVLRKMYEDEFPEILSFTGFCGIFCNSGRPCRQYSDKCERLGRRIVCYDSFASQSGRAVDTEVRLKIYEMYSGAETKDIGKEHYGMESNDPLSVLNKKQRRRIRKAIKAAKNTMKATSQSFNFGMGVAQAITGVSMRNTTTYVRKKKEPKTELFYNDNKEWEAKIEEYLGQNETNNRQPTNSAQCAKGH